MHTKKGAQYMAWYEIEYKCGHTDSSVPASWKGWISPEKRADFTKTEKEVQK